MKVKTAIFWFRRDLRAEDNAGLYHALREGVPVLPVFIFDTDILQKLEDRYDRRVDYIHQALQQLQLKLQHHHSDLLVLSGKPIEVFRQLVDEYNITIVYANRDYEPDTIRRDTEIFDFLRTKNILFRAFKDQVIFDKNQIVKLDGSAYTVYTPYAKKWRETLTDEHIKGFQTDLEKLYTFKAPAMPTLEEIGFRKTDIRYNIPRLDAAIIDEYHLYRDYPSLQKTTQLGIALRFGTISIRKCVAFALLHNHTWLSELIWREFFMQILYHFPMVTYQPFKKQYQRIKWRNNETEFAAWCEGKTGYPLVDAGMRQLNQTGFMHNRVRMVVASFLCKHLLIDWRWGEAYFAEKLNDYDLAANNGNWQWAAGCGCDAAPYFRIFNPLAQSVKFDKENDYIKKWIPELDSEDYPKPIIDHQTGRLRALTTYKSALEY